MSDLRPTGTLINVDGVERNILFTISAVYEVQEEFKDGVNEVLSSVVKKDLSEIMTFTSKLLVILANDEARREKDRGKAVQTGHFDDLITTRNVYRILGMIYSEYGIDIPEPDEDDEDPNVVSEQPVE